MPSKPALLIASKAESYLGRPLTRPELLRCEELVINFYVGGVIRYIDGLQAKGIPRNFGIIYHPIMNGLLRGCHRRRDIISIKSRFAEVYRKLESFVGDAFPLVDLEAMVQMADDSTDGEISAAIAVARMKGIHSVKYVRAVILGNRRDYMLRAVQDKRYSKVLPSKYEIRDLTKYKVPRVDLIRQTWAARLRNATEQIRLEQEALNTIHKPGVPRNEDKE